MKLPPITFTPCSVQTAPISTRIAPKMFKPILIAKTPS
jgi:hypothetical protein